MANSLFDNIVPKNWNEIGFLSLKLLSSWMIDLTNRV